MIRWDHRRLGTRGGRIAGLLLTLVLTLGAASSAQAVNCSDPPYFGVIDGNVVPPPSQIQIDQNCTFKNFPASNPLTTNISFKTQPGQTQERWLVIFDNVVHTGQMACNSVAGHKIWFVNGSSSAIQQGCQNLLIPVEKIDKQNPPGQTTASVGVPFTYSLTIPVLYDPATGNVINSAGSVNDLHSVTVTDDLNATGVDLTYISHVAYWKGSGAPVPHTFTNVGGLLTFDNFPIIPAGEQIVLEITVVLDNSPVNTVGTQFVNTAKWDFGRLIDDVFYEPLPGEWGISPPLTIAAPELVLTKTGPATLGRTLNLGQWGTFGLDVQNTGLSDAWNVTLLDRLPDGATGGMCDLTPQILSAQVFASDGVTPVPGKGPLVAGTDFTVSYTAAPTCELTLTMLTAAAAIGPGERLIVTYRTQLDSNTQDGTALTNVAGATQWFNGDPSDTNRQTYVRTLTDGTPGVLDHEDAHTVTAALYGYFFEKTVANLTSGLDPTTTAVPGDTLRYTLRLQTTDLPLSGLTFYDDLGDLNASVSFVPGTLTIVPGTLPPGADASNTDPNGGTNGDGLIDIRNLSLPANSQIQIQFDITVGALPLGTVVSNQAKLLSGAVELAQSDDPNVNGQADPDIVGDEDPTRVLIATAPVGPLLKENTQTTASVGETFRYRITVPETPQPFPIYDVKITDDLTASAADLRFAGVTKIAGSQPWTPVNTGTATNLVIEDPTIGIDIPAGEQVVVEISVVLEDTPTNVAGLAFTNTASYLYDILDDDPTSQQPGEPGTTPAMTVVEPTLTMTKSGPATMTIGTPETFILDVQNTGAGPAWNATLTDMLPDTASGGTCDAAPTAITAQVFESDGTTPASGVLVQGTDYSVSWSGAPGCWLTLNVLSDQGTIGPGQRLIVSYQTQLDANSQNGAALTNVAGAVEWFSFDASSPDRRTYTEVLTDGTVGVLDHEDAHTVTVALPSYLFEKTVVDVTSGASPATTAAPGDVLRYTLRLSNTTDVPLDNLAFTDDLGRLNATPAFEPGTLTLVTVPPGADTSGTDPNGGTNGTGLLDVRNLSLPGAGQIVIEFEIRLATTVVDGTVVTNQSQLTSSGVPFADSDDPNVNGPADPFVAGDEDPTQVLVQVPPAQPLLKENTQPSAAVGEAFRYRITVPATPYPFPMYDVRITDDLTASGADLRFLGVTKISGSQPWTPVNTGTATSLVIEDPAIGIDIPAGEQVVVEISVVLEDTVTNVSGLAFANTSDYTFDWNDGDVTSQLPGAPGTTPPMTIVGPDVLTLEKSGPATMTIGTPAPFTLDVHNTGTGPAWNLTITDVLPDGATGGTCDVPPSLVTAQVFEADGVTPVSGPLVQGTDFAVAFSGAPSCTFTLSVLSAAGTVGPDQRLIVGYETELDANTQNGITLTNVAGATEWFSADGSDPATAGDRRTFTRTLTDGTVGVLDHEDAHTVTIALPAYLFEKTVTNLTTGANPATTATPGDRLRYHLRIQNQGSTRLDGLSLSDELDRLNTPPVFEAGSLQLVTVPGGADTSNTSSTGGANGTGLVDVRNLGVDPGETLLIEFEITLVPVLPNGTVATNQSQLLINGAPLAQSDDPNVNGPADPFVAGDEDPTRVTIQSAPDFRVEKVSADLTGDPTVLLAGETLRYTITVKNVGTADAVDAMLRDAVPVNTTYVAGSTTLNGTPVPDGPSGVAPLSNGILIYAPEDPTPGAMRADASATPDNVATLVFDVVVNPGVADGTVISNQAFVSAVTGGVSDQPSDDPRTGLPDDPTRDVVGSSPLLFAAKAAALKIDGGTPGIVDPGDVLHYTITVYNQGAVPATGVVLTDNVPANTSYVADSTTLNGLPVGQPDSGVPPLASGIDISSSDLTPPLPGPGAGTLSPGQSAVLEFDLLVAAGATPGTLITNQAIVRSNELPNLLTDGDGNPATGPEPTVVVVGDSQQLSISKTVAVVGGGAAVAGAQLEYVVRVVNIAAVPASDVVISDDLDFPVAGQLAYVASSATLNGSPTGVSVAGSVITADYSTNYGPLAPGQAVVLRFRAVLDPALAIGTTVTNRGVVTWNAATQSANADVSIGVGGMPGVGALSGGVWHDADFDDAVGAGERLLAGWSVELYRNGQLVQSVLTDASGSYSITGVAPNDVTGDQYELRFRAPGAGGNTASLGTAASPFTNGPQQITAIVVSSGASLQGLNLPIDPNGVVYDAVARTPLAGATLRLLDAGSGAALPIACFDDPAQQGQVTLADGYYKFDLKFGPSCPSGGSYVIAVAAPGPGYVAGYSQIIPPRSGPSTTPLSVPTCPGGPADAVPATTQYCEAQPSAFAPLPSVPARTAGTDYHVHLTLDGSQVPGSSQIFNNHIPIDPVLNGVVGISKTTPSVNVRRGDLVPYEITFSNSLANGLPDLGIVDRLPGGFTYVEGSARLDDVPLEPLPAPNGRELVWANVGLAGSEQRTLRLLLAVGAGVTEGKFVNRAQAISSITGAPLSGEASATVRVVPDFTFDCTDVIGKVFDDVDRDGVQDDDEPGLEGVRLATVRGLLATTDRYGRFHITCAVVPREDRGSNFVLKLDDRTLPTGYRMTTRKVQVKRATRGKALHFRFGASIQRVVGLDIADPVFEPGSTEMRLQWESRLPLLFDELDKGPAILRLSYVADVEDEDLVARRIDAIKERISSAWKERGSYELQIETEVFWRRGGPPRGPAPSGVRSLQSLLPSVDAGPPVLETRAGEAAERHLPNDGPFTLWAQDPETLESESGDRLEQREVVEDEAETVKLRDVVPPIHFDSGVADIPRSYVAKLRDVLEGMQHLHNVRLHVVGHTDDQPLSANLARVYGDNAGLSRERAGEVAEFLQSALDLPPEAISFEWAGDTQPIASNATPQGRARNRRVEVEVWYDEIGEKTAVEEVVVPEEIKRVKICRMETVCKLRYREGHAHRARLRNLIRPLHVGEETVGVPEEFIREVAGALRNLRDKQNVTVKFVGFTDDVPLTGRAERIYGTHLALSKARARRVALAVQDALGLPTAAVASDGRGASRPVASNETERGRSLNRRVEVEFWYDDPLQELPDEPQMCPDAAGAELVTRVYDPPWGRLPALQIQDGDASIPPGFADELRRAMADVADKTHVRLRFVGYTGNERLDRRTAIVYGDDIGLSAARARRTMETIQQELGLSDEQVEHEGRGYVQADDVVNGGFLQGESSYVVAQVVYDELAVLDDYDGVDVTPITRELTPTDPLALNLMRITVDGKPIDDPGRSRADIQRCTDVALDRADIRFRFDDLEALPRLSVTSHPIAVHVPGAGDASAQPSTTRFRMYTNYGHFIERSEVRIFEAGQSLEAEPLAVVEIGPDGAGEWRPDPEHFAGPVRDLRYVLRAYGKDGRFDETAPQSLWMVHGDEAGAGEAAPGAEAERRPDPLLAGYGESGPLARNIPLGNVGSIEVHGSDIPPGHSVWVAGSPVPVDENGSFVAEALLPAGMHTVEVAVLDEEGNGELFLRDLELEKNDWFYMGIADVTVGTDLAGGTPDELVGEDAPVDPDAIVDGRLAFYVRGKFGKDWGLTASADTREEPVKDLFTNFLDKSPESLFRRIDPDYHYPTFGDDGTVEETAPTLGKFYLKLNQRENHALWGNFKVGYVDNELALVERGLYGANLHYQSLSTTGLGERRLVLDGFAAEPGTVPSREEFRGTGGSLYYLRRQDILEGSERLRIELRDKASGLVTGVVYLRPTLDYDIDYLQGRILLTEPLDSTVDDRLLVRSQGLSGDEAWLIVQYEYTPGFDELDALAAGGQGHYWLGDHIRFGLTASRNDDNGSDSSLYGADVTLRATTDSWFKLQGGRSEGLVSSSLLSDDGGFTFLGTGAPGLTQTDAYGYRADASLGFADVLDGARGRLTLYGQKLDAGYTAPGLTTLTDREQFGGTFQLPLTRRLHLAGKADWWLQKDGLSTHAEEVDLGYRLTEGWSLDVGVRNDDRKDDSPIVPVTQEEGRRTDAVAQVTYDSGARWRAYAFGQGTVSKSGDRDENHRGGVGGAYRVTDRLGFDGEASYGSLGPAVKLGTTFQQSEQTQRYLSYAYENEWGYDGVHERRGTLVSGVRSRLSDSSSVYLEDRFQHGEVATGLARAMGIQLAPTDRWTFSANWELGTLIDARTNAETDRKAGGARLAYGTERLQVSTGVEYRFDDTEQLDGTWTDRTTWLFRNAIRYQVTPSGRLVGKFNHSFSDSSLGQFFDGGFTEAVVGYAYRPVAHDRLHALAKYTYFYNVPATDQLNTLGTPVQFIQKSHIAALDLTYDLTSKLSIGGKYAYRLGQVSLDRVNPDFFDNNAHLYILRTDWRFLPKWETTVEGRMLHLPDVDERRTGALLTLYRYLGDNFKVGVGYNFTDFSDDLTDLSYDHHGIFFNFVGTL